MNKLSGYKKLVVFASLTFLCGYAEPATKRPKQIVIAVIDTGIDRLSNKHLCTEGHKSFVSKNLNDFNPLVDTYGHGTHVAGIIEANAGKADYCIVSLKFWSLDTDKNAGLSEMILALQHAIKLKVDIINISGGGRTTSSTEEHLISKALDMGIKVVVAAGNNGHKLTHDCNFFPACYDDRLTVVGNLDQYQRRHPTSNYGAQVNTWAVGTDVISAYPGHRLARLTGTSQATAVITGKIVRTMHKK